jgi:hypothetical protein
MGQMILAAVANWFPRLGLRISHAFPAPSAKAVDFARATS